MTTKTTRIFSILPALIFILNELIRTYLRPRYGQKKYGLISEMLGWLPNYLAGLGIITLGIAIAILIPGITGKVFSRNKKIWLLITTSIIALAGLILHETAQKGTGLYYDTQDILATIAGVISGGVLYYLVLLKHSIATN